MHDAEVDGDEEVTVKGGGGPRRRLLSLLALVGIVAVAVAVAVVVTVRMRGTSDDDDQWVRAAPIDQAALAEVEVTTGDLERVDGLFEVVAVDDHLVGFSFPWGEHAAWWSSDRGLTWQPSTGLDGSVDGYHSMVVGRRLFVADNRLGTDESSALWASDDGGRSFVPAQGLSAPGTATQVMSVVDTGDDLVAFGIRNRPRQTSWRWTSNDGGGTWTGTELDATAPEFPESIVVVDRAMVSVRPDTGADGIPVGPGLLRSDDDGITWESMTLPGWRGENTEDVIWSLAVVDGHVVASSGRQTFLASTETGAWRLLGSAPPLPDEAGQLPPEAETGAVEVVEIDGDHLVAKIGAFYDYEHEIDRLGWSADGGATWRVSDMGVRCEGYDAEADLGRPVRLGGVLVAAWNCSGAGDRGGRLLVSNDDGRTWHPEPVVTDLDTSVSPPVLIDGHVVALTAVDVEQSTDGWIDVSLGS